VNTTLFVEHYKPFFYTYKHKYKTKTIKKNTSSIPQEPTFGSENITRTTTLSFAFL